MAEVNITPDLKEGQAKSIEITLSGTPGTVSSLDVPGWAQGVKLYPQNGDIRFALNGDPAAKSTTELAAGGVGKVGMWETRLLQWGSGRTLRLLSATASVVVEVEFF